MVSADEVSVDEASVLLPIFVAELSEVELCVVSKLVLVVSLVDVFTAASTVWVVSTVAVVFTMVSTVVDGPEVNCPVVGGPVDNMDSVAVVKVVD